MPVAADPADITDEKSAELIATFNGVLDNDGLSFYPDWPAPGFYDVIVQELQGLVTGVQDAETTNANLGERVRRRNRGVPLIRGGGRYPVRVPPPSPSLELSHVCCHPRRTGRA